MNIIAACSCYQRLAFTRFCVPLAMANAGIDVAWVLVNDGSTDGTGEFLQSIEGPKVEVLNDPHNVGFPERRNRFFDMAICRGADCLVLFDNDLLLPPNWLRDFVHAFVTTDLAIGAVWLVNDKTVRKILTQNSGRPIHKLNKAEWINTGACGGTCTIMPQSFLKAGLRYNTRRLTFAYNDGDFHPRVVRAGFKIGIYTGVQAWMLERIFWQDEKYERAKLAVRHQVRGDDPKTFEQSVARYKAGLIAVAQ